MQSGGGALRIIAGSARGRRFDAPEGMDTRPTLDRVKESLFGMLQFDIPGSAVLDLFSGSGNLGLEAASRGASKVVCNDRSRDCVAQIRKNAAILGLDGVVRTQCMDFADCLRGLEAAGERFDLVFLDAPYQDGTAQSAADMIFSLGLLRPRGRVVIEHDAKLPPVLSAPYARLADTRRYGSCAVSIYESNDGEA
jgi:16S rRNA (guanine(966)-N(2))-methyltransferase RsmD